MRCEAVGLVAKALEKTKSDLTSAIKGEADQRTQADKVIESKVTSEQIARTQADKGITKTVATHKSEFVQFQTDTAKNLSDADKKSTDEDTKLSDSIQLNSKAIVATGKYFGLVSVHTRAPTIDVSKHKHKHMNETKRLRCACVLCVCAL